MRFRGSSRAMREGWVHEKGLSPSSPGMAQGPEALAGWRPWEHTGLTGLRAGPWVDQGDPSVSWKKVEGGLELSSSIERSWDRERGPRWAPGERWESAPPGPPEQSLPAWPGDSRASGRGCRPRAA